ncbi:MAG: triple tyrosine motif-containing protein [Coriobacteriales bacterium]|jgi:hypothetical protein
MIAGITGRVGQPLTIAGYANDYDRRICAVQFSLDDGETWTTYETPNTVPDKNLYWRFEYTPEQPGNYQLLVRSVNEDGVASPIPAAIDFTVS